MTAIAAIDGDASGVARPMLFEYAVIAADELEPACRERRSSDRSTRTVALVLAPLSALLVGMTVGGAQIPTPVHTAAHVLVLAFVPVYPVYRLTRWLIGKWLPRARRRWVVWNAAWVACCLWFSWLVATGMR